jgi:hypothetical protein
MKSVICSKIWSESSNKRTNNTVELVLERLLLRTFAKFRMCRENFGTTLATNNLFVQGVWVLLMLGYLTYKAGNCLISIYESIYLYIYEVFYRALNFVSLVRYILKLCFSCWIFCWPKLLAARRIAKAKEWPRDGENLILLVLDIPKILRKAVKKLNSSWFTVYRSWNNTYTETSTVSASYNEH